MIKQAEQRIPPLGSDQRNKKWNFYYHYGNLLFTISLEIYSEGKKVIYYYHERPLGFCVLSWKGEQLNIDYLLGDGEVGGVGKILIEAAVNYSEHQGKHGIVTLDPSTKESETIYRKCGYTEGISMTLNPRTSDVWSFVEGKGWVIKLATPYDQHVIDVSKEKTQCCVLF